MSYGNAQNLPPAATAYLNQGQGAQSPVKISSTRETVENALSLAFQLTRRIDQLRGQMLGEIPSETNKANPAPSGILNSLKSSSEALIQCLNQAGNDLSAIERELIN